MYHMPLTVPSSKSKRKKRKRIYFYRNIAAIVIISFTAINIYCTVKVLEHTSKQQQQQYKQEEEQHKQYRQPHNHYQSYDTENTIIPLHDDNDNNNKKLNNNNCALLFFGLPKKFREIIYPSIKKNIIDINTNCDVYLHTYNVSFSPRNIRNKEPKATFNLNDVYILTNNVTFTTEKQFLEIRNVSYYRQFFPPKNRSWIYPISMDNMIKQWHSIDSVWNYMESKTSSFNNNNNRYYNRVGLFRSDQVYLSPINISDGNAVIPEYGWNIPNIELNDRFFYGLYEYAKIWATYRFKSVDDYLYNCTVAKYTGLHSETILYYIMNKYLPRIVKKDDNGDNVNDNSASILEKRKLCAKRVRSTGRKENDCWCKDFGKVCYWAKSLK